MKNHETRHPGCHVRCVTSSDLCLIALCLVPFRNMPAARSCSWRCVTTSICWRRITTAWPSGRRQPWRWAGRCQSVVAGIVDKITQHSQGFKDELIYILVVRVTSQNLSLSCECSVSIELWGYFFSPQMWHKYSAGLKHVALNYSEWHQI